MKHFTLLTHMYDSKKNRHNEWFLLCIKNKEIGQGFTNSQCSVLHIVILKFVWLLSKMTARERLFARIKKILRHSEDLWKQPNRTLEMWTFLKIRMFGWLLDMVKQTGPPGTVREPRNLRASIEINVLPSET